MTTLANRIVLTGDFRLEEAIAAAALSPGHLIEIINVSGVINVQKHSKKGGNHERYFAIENALVGLEPGFTPGGVTAATAYNAADLVEGALMVPGGVVSAYLTPGTNYVIGTKLISNGDGTLSSASSTDSSVVVDQIVGVLLEPLNLSASGAVATRGVVRVI